MIKNPAQSFEDWLAGITESLYNDDDQSELVAGATEFLRTVYTQCGPLQRADVVGLWNAEQLRVAYRCVASVTADVHATTALSPHIDVKIEDTSVAIVYNGAYTAPSMWSVAQDKALIEVAEYLQDRVHEDQSRGWPVCRLHDAVAHADLHRAGPVWFCRPGDHVLGSIGQLSESDEVEIAD